MQIDLKFIVACIAAPACPSTILHLLLTKELQSSNHIGIFISILYSYAGFILIGVSTILLLNKIGKLSFLNLALCSISSGVVMYLFFLLALHSMMGSTFEPSSLNAVWFGALYVSGPG
ncbi:hypothetical protein SDC9_99953 [bioreactor metagenome]|uniref:Uncharacterized protein n=1 Tax=bioreactor metagenome TaxID=1076179 RepID=A0A645AKC8_9ZZZZ